MPALIEKEKVKTILELLYKQHKDKTGTFSVTLPIRGKNVTIKLSGAKDLLRVYDSPELFNDLVLKSYANAPFTVPGSARPFKTSAEVAGSGKDKVLSQLSATPSPTPAPAPTPAPTFKKKELTGLPQSSWWDDVMDFLNPKKKKFKKAVESAPKK